jgi:hypothetical protein
MNDVKRDPSPLVPDAAVKAPATSTSLAMPAQRHAVDMELMVVDKRNALHVYAVNETTEKAVVEAAPPDAEALANNRPDTDIRSIAMSMAAATPAATALHPALKPGVGKA